MIYLLIPLAFVLLFFSLVIAGYFLEWTTKLPVPYGIASLLTFIFPWAFMTISAVMFCLSYPFRASFP